MRRPTPEGDLPFLIVNALLSRLADRGAIRRVILRYLSDVSWPERVAAPASP